MWGLLLCSPASAMAQAPVTDKSVLNRLQLELQALEPLIREARQAPVHRGSRLRFDYGALEQDLQTVRRGIAQYLEAPVLPRAQPILPLSGQYAR